MGLLGLLGSRNGVLALIVLFVSAVLCFTGHVDGPSFAAVCATVSCIYQFTRAHYAPRDDRFVPPSS